MECITLKKVPNWSEIEKVVEFISNKGFFNPNFDTALFDQFMLTLQYVTQEEIDEWNLEKKPTDQRWVCIFKYFKEQDIQCDKMIIIEEYVLCLPGFQSHIKNLDQGKNPVEFVYIKGISNSQVKL